MPKLVRLQAAPTLFKSLMRPTKSLILLLTLLLATACTLATPQAAEAPSTNEQAADTLTPVTLGVGFVPNVQFAPFYVGIEQGFFADEGIDLTLDYGFENDYLVLVGTGELPFLIGSGDQVILGRAQGLPVRYVAEWYTRYPAVVVAPKEAAIADPADLAGRTIGLPGLFGANYVALRGVLEAGGLTERDVTLESIGFTQAAALSAGTVDAVVDYGVNSPVILAQEGISTTQIALDDYLPLPSNGLITNEATLDENPDLVRSMARAMLRSIDYTLDNPDEAFSVTLDYVPEARNSEATNRAVFDAVLDYWQPRGDGLPGETTLDAWQSAAEFMQRIGLVETVLPAEELFTNEFVE